VWIRAHPWFKRNLGPFLFSPLITLMVTEPGPLPQRKNQCRAVLPVVKEKDPNLPSGMDWRR
jgi:hypothetical protein